MHRSILIVALLARSAFANDPPAECQGSILFPADGQTNVAPDAPPIVARPPCAGEPTFIDAHGQPVAFDLQPVERDDTAPNFCWHLECFRVVARVPLAAGADFEVALPLTSPDECGRRVPMRARFHTAARPALLAIAPVFLRLSDRPDEVHALNVRFSEPIDGAALGTEPSVLRVEREDGAELPSRIDPTGDTSNVIVTFKLAAVRPAAGTRFRVRISKALKFVSGASLAADVDVTTAFGVRGGQQLEACPEPVAGGWGCTTEAGAALSLVAALALRARRRCPNVHLEGAR